MRWPSLTLARDDRADRERYTAYTIQQPMYGASLPSHPSHSDLYFILSFFSVWPVLPHLPLIDRPFSFLRNLLGFADLRLHLHLHQHSQSPNAIPNKPGPDPNTDCEYQGVSHSMRKLKLSTWNPSRSWFRFRTKKQASTA